MDDIPLINQEQVAEIEEIIRQKMMDQSITHWLDSKLGEIQSANPVLYKYIMEHSQKIAIGSSMAHDTKMIAVSQCFENVLLVMLLSMGMKDSKEFENFNNFWGRFWEKEGGLPK